jgi:hypothetical protein
MRLSCSGLPQQRRRLAHGALVERHEHLAARPEPLAHLDGTIAWHERPRLLELRVVQRRPHLPRDLEQVAEALRGDEAAPRDLALDDGVRRDRRCVHDEPDLGGVDRAVCQRALDRGHEPSRRVGGRGQRLRDRNASGLFVDQRCVRERAADVDGHTYGHTATP